MHQRAFLGGGWTRGGTSEVVRRAHPASGAQWNVQVVRGKVNGKCLWNACKALSLGLLLMVLGAAMATIGYYADHLSENQETRGNSTFKVKNETRGFHLNNLSYAGPIVMGVGGFIVVAACVMTFEARDSAAKVVPARFKMSTSGGQPQQGSVCAGHRPPPGGSRHSSLKTSGVQTSQYTAHHPHAHCHSSSSTAATDRRTLTQSFMHFSRGLALETQHKSSLKVPQGSINRSPSAPDLVLQRSSSGDQTNSPILNRSHNSSKQPSPRPKTFAACALLNPSLLHRHALSVDETAGNFRLSNESLHQSGSQGSMAMDLHLECPVTLRIRDRRRNPLKRQRRVEEDNHFGGNDCLRRGSHTRSIKSPPRERSSHRGGSAHHIASCSPHCPTSSSGNRRSSNASDCTHRSRTKKRDCPYKRGHLERAISSDSRLTGAIPKCYHHQHRHHNTPAQNSTEEPPPATSSDTDVMHSPQNHLSPQNG